MSSKLNIPLHIEAQLKIEHIGQHKNASTCYHSSLDFLSVTVSVSLANTHTHQGGFESIQHGRIRWFAQPAFLWPLPLLLSSVFFFLPQSNQRWGNTVALSADPSASQLVGQACNLQQCSALISFLYLVLNMSAFYDDCQAQIKVAQMHLRIQLPSYEVDKHFQEVARIPP